MATTPTLKDRAARRSGIAFVVLLVVFRTFVAMLIPIMLAIAVIWNPVYPLPIDGPWWVGAQYVAILVFVLAGVLIKVPFTEQDAKR